jgi:hypothetical protein
MVLFGSGIGNNRVIIIGCDIILDVFERSDTWLADGIFKVVPSIF